MEQKKTLWIIAGVGLFLLVVVGAAMILSTPSQTVEPSIASLQVQNDTWTLPSVSTGINQAVTSGIQPNTTDFQNTLPVDSGAVQVQPNAAIVPNSESVQQQPNDGIIAVDNMTVYSGTTNVQGTGTTTIDLNTIKYNAPQQTSSVTAVNQVAAEALSSAAASKNVATEKVSSVPAASNVASTTTSFATAEAKIAEVKTAAKTSAGTKNTTSAASKNTVAKNTSASVKNTATQNTTAAKMPDQYWVQAASFTSKANAESARSVLNEEKIESEVFTYTDSKGKTYYRLRVGPYSTKTEAEYWRSRIALIEEFADSQSYVTNSSAKKQ